MANGYAEHLAEVVGDTFIDWQVKSPLRQWEAITSMLTEHGFRVVHPDESAEHCEDPWVCCIHTRPTEGAENEDEEA